MNIKNIITNFKPGTGVTIRGRIIAKRSHGSFDFIDIRDQEEKIQVIAKNNEKQQKTGLGDLVEIYGNTDFSRSGEKSIILENLKIIAPCQETIPFKSGLSGKADRILYRHEDFILNSELMRFFGQSSRLIFAIRRKLFENGYLEFDTRILQSRFDAGFAKPFETLMHANNKKYFLHLTSEMRLKQLIAAGFDKVFELSKSFRNEGKSAINNPEFALLEIYESFATCDDLALLMEKIISDSIEEAFGKTVFNVDNETIDYKRPWRKISVERLGKEKLGEKFRLDIGKEELLDIIGKKWNGSEEAFSPQLTLGQLLWDCIEKILVIDEKQPVFLTHIPAAISPLAKESSEISGASERILLVINGIPIADFYTDENRVEILQLKLEEQSKLTGKSINPAFLHALKCGLPSTAGMGMGIERLLLCLRHSSIPKHINEVILFPDI